MKKLRDKKTAFTLIELSVLLLVISILAAGVLSVSNVNVKNNKVEITQKRMQTIYKAIAAYVAENGALPCPASLSDSVFDVNFGNSVGVAGACTDSLQATYVSSTQANVVYGAVPVRALGIALENAIDGFDSKIVYVVAENYTIAEFPNLVSFNGFSFANEGATNTIRVINLTSNDVKSDVAFSLISFGENRYGAFNAGLQTQNDAVSSNVYEQQNYISNINSISNPKTADFGQHGSYANQAVFIFADETDSSFDDILFFKSRKDLLKDYPNLMYLAGCDLNDSGWAAGYNMAYYNAVSYSTSSCPMPNVLVFPGKICGLYGENWINRVSCP